MKKLFAQSDWLGITAAGLCFIHCAIFPLFIVVGGSVKHAHNHDHNNFPLVDSIFLLIGLIAVWYSARASNSNLMKILLWTTYLVLAISLLFQAHLYWLEYVAYVASFGLIGVHLLNLSRMKNQNTSTN